MSTSQRNRNGIQHRPPVHRVRSSKEDFSDHGQMQPRGHEDESSNTESEGSVLTNKELDSLKRTRKLQRLERQARQKEVLRKRSRRRSIRLADKRRNNTIEVPDEAIDSQAEEVADDEAEEEENEEHRENKKVRVRPPQDHRKSVIVITSSDEEEEGLDDDDVTETEGEGAKAGSGTQIIDSSISKDQGGKKLLSFYECPICFESPDKTIALPCGHCYCFDCLFQAFSHSRTAKKTDAVCALCRSSYTLRQTVPLKFKVALKL